jgi:hypothetical protein
LFPTCSIQVPNGFPLVIPFFYEKMAIEKVSVAIRGKAKKRKKNWGWEDSTLRTREESS